MSMPRFREETHNVLLAQILTEHGVVSSPEQIHNRLSRELPDVVVEFRGLRTVLEGKVNDSSSARQNVLSDAIKRVESGLALISVAVLYPKELRTAEGIDELKQAISEATLQFSVCTEDGAGDFLSGTVERLAEMLRRSFQDLLAQDAVSDAVRSINLAVDTFAGAMATVPAAVDRFADILGISSGKVVE